MEQLKRSRPLLGIPDKKQKLPNKLADQLRFTPESGDFDASYSLLHTKAIRVRLNDNTLSVETMDAELKSLNPALIRVLSLAEKW